MTSKEKEIINSNLNAFLHNFGTIRIDKEDAGKGFYVYYPSTEDSYIQFCPDINYLDGWLYGAVQAKQRGEFKNIVFDERTAQKITNDILTYLRDEFPEPMSYHFTYDMAEQIILNILKELTFIDTKLTTTIQILEMITGEHEKKDIEEVEKILSKYWFEEGVTEE